MLGRLVLLIAFLIAAVTLIQLVRKTPKAQLKNLYWKFGLSALAIALVLLAVTGRIHWIGAAIGALLPFLRRLIPLVVRYFPLFHQWHRTRPRSTPGGGPGSGNTSRVDTRVLRMTMDHDHQRLSGEVLLGPFVGRQLDSMTLTQLKDLLSYCHREDKDATRLLMTYLDHRFGKHWQQQSDTGPSRDGPMDEAAAYAVLGLKPGASREEIITAHRRMMQKMHPDRGGSDYLAAQINQAKDLLIGRSRT